MNQEVDAAMRKRIGRNLRRKPGVADYNDIMDQAYERSGRQAIPS